MLRTKFLSKYCGMLAFAILLASALSSPAHAEYVDKSNAEFDISIRVIPRIGMFWHRHYQENYGGDCILQQKAVAIDDFTSYAERLNKTPWPLEYTLPEKNPQISAMAGIASWDIITTTDPDSPVQCGYKARRVAVLVTPKTDRDFGKCEFTFIGAKAVPVSDTSYGKCLAYINLHANTATKFEVVIRDEDGAHRFKLHGTVPEDILIASLGDSFSSGEGNPDVPKNRKESARWMDSRCHRSVYAGPARAALHLMKRHRDMKNVAYGNALAAGAVTIVNFSCSGAKIGEGLNGSYEGVVEYDKAIRTSTEVAQLLGRPGNTGGGVSAHPDKMQPQIAQLENFLGTPDVQSKRTVDLLLLSGGGNDLQFGPLATAMVTKDISDAQLRATVDESLRVRFPNLKESYRLLRNALARFEEQHPVRMTMLTRYPDPFYQAPGRNCIGSAAIGAAERRWQKPILRALQLSNLLELTDDETEYLRKNFVKGLNDELVVQQASGHWIDIDTSLTASGWCLSGDAQPYIGQGRWFRSAVDSYNFQGNLNGSFHPTWQFTDGIQGTAIADKFIQIANSEPKWDEIRFAPSKPGKDVLYIPERVAIQYHRTDTVSPRIAGPANITMPCAAGGNDCGGLPGDYRFGNHGDTVVIDAFAVHDMFPRKFERKGFRTLKVDAMPPSILCVKGPEGKQEDCTKRPWQNSKRLEIVVEDKDAGVKSAVVHIMKTDLTRSTQVLGRVDETRMTAALDLESDGRYAFAVCAHDEVNNSTGSSNDCATSFIVELSTEAPKFVSARAYRTDWQPDKENKVTLPIFGRNEPVVDLFVQSRIPGATCEPSCQVRPSRARANWAQTNGSISARDAAGNTAVLHYQAIALPEFDSSTRRKSLRDWIRQTPGAQLVAGTTTLLALEPRLAGLLDAAKPAVANALRTMQDSSASEALRLRSAKLILAELPDPVLVADWLNLLYGAVHPEDRINKPKLTACELGDGQPDGGMFQLKWLQNRTHCAIGRARPLSTAGR